MAKTPIRITMEQLVPLIEKAYEGQHRLFRTLEVGREAIRADAKAEALHAVYLAILGHPENLEDLGGGPDAS
jgi:hypothetical protein